MTLNEHQLHLNEIILSSGGELQMIRVKKNESKSFHKAVRGLDSKVNEHQSSNPGFRLVLIQQWVKNLS